MKLIYVRHLCILLATPIHLLSMTYQKPDKRLIEATMVEDRSLIQHLIDEHVDLNVQDAYGYTALIWASRTPHLNYLVPIFINAACKLNLICHKGRTALLWAASDGCADAVRALVEAGAALDVQDGEGYTALMLAASHDFTDIAKMLIKAEANLNTQDHTGFTALILSALHHRKAAQILIESGADLDKQTSWGTTALMRAVYDPDTTIARMLIEAGAQFYMRNNKRQTATDMAWELDADLALGSHLSSMITYLDKVQSAHTQLFALLITPTPNIRLKQSDPLTYQRQVLELQKAMRGVKDLNSKQLIINFVDAQGNRPLHAALLAQNKYMVQLILKLMLQAKRGESITQTNSNGHTPVHLAVGQSPDLWLRLLGKFTDPLCSQKNRFT